jgi:predicted RNase H-like HicB family nuclease
MNYLAYLHKDPKSDYGVSFPDFPGCVTAGKTLEEARQMAAEALTLHIKGIIEDGEAIPKPSTLDALANDPAREGAVVFLVHVEPNEKRVRINITAQERQIEEIDRLANQAGLTRSAYMVRSALHAKFHVVGSGPTVVSARQARQHLRPRAAKKISRIRTGHKRS